MEKANVLIEALPYIQRFNRKIIVIKYGGSAMIDDDLKKHVIEDAVLLKLVGFKPVIVHGGGNEISRWMRKAGIEPQFINGLRVTDADTLEIAEMVLGKVNSDLVTMAQQLGVRACGISGKDGTLSYVGISGRALTAESEGIRPHFDIKVEAKENSPTMKKERNELIRALYEDGAFKAENVKETLIMLELMDFDGVSRLRSALSREYAPSPAV